MAVITPPSVTSLPTPPSTISPANFDSRADTFLGGLPTYQTEQNALAANVYANAVDAASSATLAASQVTNATTQAGNAAISAAEAVQSALAAAISAGAAAWVSGTTYAIGDVRYSLITLRVYRRLTNGAGATDPSADGTNWKSVDANPVVQIVSGTTQAATAFNHYVLTNVAATTVTLPASPASGDTVWVTVTNGLSTNTIARNAQLIMGVAEDMTIDNQNATVELRFVNSSWRLV
jgi:hypothetical protein